MRYFETPGRVKTDRALIDLREARDDLSIQISLLKKATELTRPCFHHCDTRWGFWTFASPNMRNRSAPNGARGEKPAATPLACPLSTHCRHESFC